MTNGLGFSKEVKSIRRQEKDFAGLLSSNVTADFDVNEQEIVIMEMEMFWLEVESTNSSPATWTFGTMVSGSTGQSTGGLLG